MQYLGDYRIDDYITFGAQLHRFSSGAVYAPTGNVTYTYYENNSTSGAPTGGNLSQLNSKTGLYTARVQLTTASGFEAGKEYLIHIEATVDSVAAAELLMFRIISNPKVDVDTIKTQTVTCSGGVTVPAATLASTTNITSSAGAVLADASSDAVIADAVWNALTASYGSANTYGALVETNLDATVSSRLAPAGTLATVTNLTNLPSIPANWITAAGINTGAITNAKFAAGAIDAAAIATGAIDADAIAADAIGSSEFAQAAADKIWASATRTVTAATNITSTGGTTVPQTGDSFARIGANGVGLTSVALADATSDGVVADAVWNALTANYGSANTYGALVETNLDATVSSRLAPAGTLATVTNLTNAPTAGDLTATMKASVNTEIDTALADINLDHLVGTATGIPAIVAGTYIDQMMDDGTATFDRTTDSLQAIRDSGGSADWTAGEREQIRSALGVDGNKTTATGGQLQTIDGIVDSILDDTGTAGVVIAGDLTSTMKASVNAEIVDALTVDTYAEPGSVPAATSSIKDMIKWLFTLGRNKVTQSSTTMTLRNDSDSGNIATAAVQDDGTFTRSEWS